MQTDISTKRVLDRLWQEVDQASSPTYFAQHGKRLLRELIECVRAIDRDLGLVNEAVTAQTQASKKKKTTTRRTQR